MSSKNLSSPTKISCILPTYNRVQRDADGRLEAPLLEEAVMSFLMQSNQDAELIILNDTPGQPLEISEEFPSVRVINFGERFPSLGEKCNWGIRAATGRYVTRWDDDDISLPKRLQNAIDVILAHELDVLVVQGYFYYDYGSRQWSILTGGYGFQQDVYRRSLALAHPYQASSNGEDQAFRHDLLASPAARRTLHYQPAAEDLTYIYRWGVSPMHLSTGLEHGEAKYQQIGTREVLRLESPYQLQPHWRAHYPFLTEDLLKKQTPDQPKATTRYDNLPTGFAYHRA